MAGGAPRGACRPEVRRLLRRRRRAHQARRPAHRRAPSKAGHDVVVVVSAMGDTTDELIDLAEQVTPMPHPRELDMLLTAGERISMALLAMAIANLGHEARSLHRQPGRRHHRLRPRQGAHHRRHPGPHPTALDDGRHRDRRRLPGRLARTPRTSPRSAAAARTPPRSRSPRRWTPTCARSTPTSTACSPPTRAIVPTRAAARPASPTRRCSSWPQPAPRCCTCAAWSTRVATTFPIHVRSSFTQPRGHVGQP